MIPITIPGTSRAVWETDRHERPLASIPHPKRDWMPCLASASDCTSNSGFSGLRSSSPNNTNPFGSTFCFGLQRMIFEVSPLC